MRGKNKIPAPARFKKCHIGVDLLGSDVAPDKLLDAIIAFSRDLNPSIGLTLFGTQELFSSYPPSSDRIIFHPVSEIIYMSDNPLHAIRHKKQSSLYLGIEMLKKGPSLSRRLS